MNSKEVKHGINYNFFFTYNCTVLFKKKKNNERLTYTTMHKITLKKHIILTDQN